MTQKAVFVSDLHLRDSQEENARRFLKFLDFIEQGDWTHLFLLGDVFDLWIADHSYFSIQFAEVIEKLRSLRRRGIEIHYFEGNHDLDLHPFFGVELGCVIHESAYCTTFAGQRIRIEHGDEMDPDDRDYLFLRWLLRTPSMRWLGRRLPGRIVSLIGETASKGSRKYTDSVRKGMENSEVDRKLLEHAKSAYQQMPFDILVAGHVHREIDQILKRTDHEVRVINLGTWLHRPLVFQLSEGVARISMVDDFLNGKPVSAKTEPLNPL